MEYILYLLFLGQILFINCAIPNWNIDALSVELFSPSSSQTTYLYDLYKKSGFVLTKNITRKSDGTLTSRNQLTYNSVTKIVAFEGIESVYFNQLQSEVLICPKGSFHPYEFYNDYYIKPFDYEGNWELSCHKHDTGYFLVFYAHNGNKALYYVEGNNRNYARSTSFKELYDYKLYEYTNEGHNHNYDLPSLQKRNGSLVISGYSLIMNPGESKINGNEIYGKTTIIKAKSDTRGSIDSNYNFYYFTYNNVSDFSSGYSNTYLHKGSSDYAKSFSITHTDISPLTFVDNVEIKEIKFIPGTKNVYYKIYNQDKGTYYYGLIDVKKNQVIYNLEGDENTIFIPDTTGNMLAITSNKMYRVCMLKNTTTGECVSESDCSNLLLDPDGNKCQENCDTDKIKMMPESICITLDKCDLHIYVLNTEQTECGLCSYFYPNGTKYKIINTQECLSYVPNNTEYYNQQWNLLKCKENYTLDNNKCVPDYCYEACQTCSEISNNITDQKCTSCKTGYKLENGNCIIPPTTIVTQAPTTIIKKIPTTIITTIPTTEIELEPCINKRCLICDKGSNRLKLCLSCNEDLYGKVNYTNNFSKYVDCFEKKVLENKYYYDSTTEQYKPCYRLCKKCLGPGNATEQNCLLCEDNYMFRPGHNPKNNCVVFSENYYISPYDEYRPMNTPQCPEEAKYRIKDDKNNKTSCIFDCKVDEVYKYLYNGNCIKNCSLIEGTENKDFICKETDPNKIYISENPIYFDGNDTIKILQTLAITYAKEFNYTDKHISVFRSPNNDTTVALYKNVSIGDTKLKLPNIDFGDCYDKVIKYYNITSLITGIVDKKLKNNPSTFYLFFHPETGMKLDIGNICENDTIEIKENLLSILDENKENYNLQVSLTKQGINIFDLSDPFYKDICYDFENPKNRDMALKDRIKETYVDADLCDDGCVNTGIDISNNEATCNCKFKEVTNNELIHENAALEYLVGELFDFISSSNIMVLKCYKYLFKHFGRSKGGVIILLLFILNIIFTILFFFYELTKLKRYIFILTENFTSFLTQYPNLANFFPPKRTDIKNKKSKILNFANEDNKKNKFQRNKSKSIKTLNPISNSKQQLNSKDLIIYNKKQSNAIPKEKKNLENTSHIFDKGKKIKKYFKEYLATSPDDMEYDDAIKFDKRSFGRYFLDNLEQNQSFAYTFFARDKINTRMIKLILFVLNICLYFVVNGFFFSEAYISELYHSGEKDKNFFSFVPRTIDKIFYTTIVAVFINYLTEFFFLSENKVKGIFKREQKNKVVLKKSIVLLIQEIQKRYISFIIMTQILFLFSLYYVLCFNYVYPKTQVEWIKSSILIIIIMQILSILKCLFEAIFRFLSFKCESEKLFKLSKFFEKNS